MDIRKIFSDHGYEVEATKGFNDQIDLVIRKDNTRIFKMSLPKDHDLKSFAAGILVGATLRNPEAESINTTGESKQEVQHDRAKP